MPPVFMCDWPTRSSLLVDDVSEASAREVAREVSGGIEPSRVRALPPRVVVLELFTETVTVRGEELEELHVAPLPHVEAAFFDLLEDDDAPALRLVPAASAKCQEEAYDANDAIVRCELAAAHEGMHAHGLLSWADEGDGS